jgi:gamma-glutamylcyclotransferase (GGCT)/AIG2-like uncharacterized protein YtfP
MLPVFVYGTLRNGFGNYNWALKGKTEKEETALLEGSIYPVHSGGGFPCLIEEEGLVHGELMYIKPDLYDDVMQSLDNLEGYFPKRESTSMYVRRVRDVHVGTKTIKAYVYVYNRPLRTKRIESGDWVKFAMGERV